VGGSVGEPNCCHRGLMCSERHMKSSHSFQGIRISFGRVLHPNQDNWLQVGDWTCDRQCCGVGGGRFYRFESGTNCGDMTVLPAPASP